MRILVELFWHIVGLIGFCLFCLSLPFLVIWVVVFHPAWMQADEFCFFTYAALLSGGVAVMLWWALIRALRGRHCGLGASLLVMCGGYAVEVLLLMTGIVRLP